MKKDIKIELIFVASLLLIIFIAGLVLFCLPAKADDGGAIGAVAGAIADAMDTSNDDDN